MTVWAEGKWGGCNASLGEERECDNVSTTCTTHFFWATPSGFTKNLKYCGSFKLQGRLSLIFQMIFPFSPQRLTYWIVTHRRIELLFLLSCITSTTTDIYRLTYWIVTYRHVELLILLSWISSTTTDILGICGLVWQLSLYSSNFSYLYAWRISIILQNIDIPWGYVFFRIKCYNSLGFFTFFQKTLCFHYINLLLGFEKLIN